MTAPVTNDSMRGRVRKIVSGGVVRPPSAYTFASYLLSFGACLCGGRQTLAAPLPDVAGADFRPPAAPSVAPKDKHDVDEPVRHVPLPLTITLGEKLVYEVRWSGMPAGQSVLLVKYRREIDGSPVFHIECRTKSNAFLDMIYPVDDRALTVVDAKEGYSRLFEMTIKEGRVPLLSISQATAPSSAETTEPKVRSMACSMRRRSPSSSTTRIAGFRFFTFGR